MGQGPENSLSSPQTYLGRCILKKLSEKICSAWKKEKNLYTIQWSIPIWIQVTRLYQVTPISGGCKSVSLVTDVVSQKKEIEWACLQGSWMLTMATLQNSILKFH